MTTKIKFCSSEVGHDKSCPIRSNYKRIEIKRISNRFIIHYHIWIEFMTRMQMGTNNETNTLSMFI